MRQVAPQRGQSGSMNWRPCSANGFSTVESISEELRSVWDLGSPPWPRWRTAYPLIDCALSAISADRSQRVSQDDRYAHEPTSVLLALSEPSLARRVANWLRAREDGADLELMHRAVLDTSLPMHAAVVMRLPRGMIARHCLVCSNSPSTLVPESSVPCSSKHSWDCHIARPRQSLQNGPPVIMRRG